MNKAGRIYITLNPNKEKDKIILDYLETTYSYSETIKNILFQRASQSINKVHIGTEFTKENKNVMEQKGANNINKVLDAPYINRTSMEEIKDIDDDIKNMFL